MFDFSVNGLLESNLFNFVVMVAIFALIAKGVKIGEKLEGNKQKIVETVNSAVQTKETSHSELKKVEESVKNLSDEIKTIVDNAKESLATLEKKIVADSEKQVSSIEANVSKVVESEASKLTSKLAKGVSNASVALAECNMRKLLRENADLHNKFIYDSIDELDRVEI